MKNICLIIVLCFLLAGTTSAQTDSIAKAGQLVKIEQQLMNAMPGDTKPWQKYLDDKWRIVTEDGTGYDKAGFLKMFSKFPVGFSGNIKVIKPVFVFYNNIAVLHYVADEHETVYGQTLHTTYATEDTWYNENGSWKMLSSQIFEVPQLPKPVKISVAMLKSYTGTYSLSGIKTVVISLKGDSLYIQKGTGKPEALLPETNTVFFKNSDTRGRKLFVKTPSGNMMMLERRNGNDLIWKKIK